MACWNSSALSTAISADSSYVSAILSTASKVDYEPNVATVVDKLESLPGYRFNTHIRDEAENLAIPVKIMRVFNSYLDAKQLLTFNNVGLDNDSVTFTNGKELSEAKKRQQRRYRELVTIPLKFCSRDVKNYRAILKSITKFVETDWGAKHVSLIVGDFLLEWGRESLVIPRLVSSIDPASLGEVMQITDQCPYNNEANSNSPDARNPLLTLDEEAKILRESMKEVRKQYENLADLIVKYNTKYHYKALTRNCQTFVRDALRCLGVDNVPEVEPNERFMELLVQKREDIPAFESHKELDDFVRSHRAFVEKLDGVNQEYIKMCYSVFHGSLPCHKPSCAFEMLFGQTPGII